MTDKQRLRWYLPAWHRAAAAQQWRMQQRRLVSTQPDAWGGPETTAMMLRIWAAAEAMADADNRAPKPEDFRHACNAVAVQRVRQHRNPSRTAPLAISEREISSKRMDQLELEMAVAVMALCADPDDLRAMLVWTDPSACERRRLEWSIQAKYHPDYVRRIASDRFGTANWQSLSNPQLRQLIMQLTHRPAGRRPERAAA